MSICLGFVFKSPFSIVILLDKLSVKIVISFSMLNNSLIRFLIHSTLLIHSEVLMYSASVVEVATIVCFLDDQQIGDCPIKMMYPDVDFLSVVSPAKSESEYAATKLPEPLYVI